MAEKKTMTEADLKAHIPLLKVLAKRYFADADDRKDLVQNTLLRAWENRRQFSPEKGKIQNWLSTLLYHTAIDTIRYNKSRNSCRLEDLTEAEAPPRVDCRRLIHNLPRLFKRAKLTEAETEVMLLRAWGLKYEDIEAVSGLKLGTVKNKIFCAHRKIKAISSRKDFLEEIMK